jgi:hypothetical protein
MSRESENDRNKGSDKGSATSGGGSPSRSGRRQFMASVGVSAAALISAPSVILARKSDDPRPIVGSGENQYECIHDWGDLPDGHEYGGASHGVAIDSAGMIYITHHGRPGSIFVFDPEGRLVRAMGERFMEKGSGVGHGIDIRREGNEEFLYLSPDNNTFGFAKMTLTGEVVWQKDRRTIAEDSGKYEDPQAPFRATNISFSPDGGFYLGDGYGSGYIHRYDSQARYISSFGGTGDENGKFRTPHGQWLDDRDGTPKVAVCDRAGKRLQFFDLEGNYLSQLGGFLFPADIDIQGEIMLVPDLHCRITLLDRDNRVLVHLGDDEAWRALALEKFQMRAQRDRWRPGRFVHPHDACFDSDGNIFVAEWVQTGRVTKLRKLS